MRKEVFGVWAATTVTVVVLFCFLSRQWPLVCSDAVAYWPPIIHGGEHGEFNNPTWTGAALYDPDGKARLTYHGFLLQWISRHLGGSTYLRIFMVVGFFALVALTAFAGCLTKILARNVRPLSGWRMAYLACLPPAMGHLFLGVFSRPEALVMVWAVLLCFVLIGESNWSRGKAVITGVLLALCGLTSPVSSILMGGLVAVIAAMKLPPIQMLKWLFVCGFAASASGIVIFLGCYPFDLNDWIFGNLNHARRAVWSSSAADYTFFWLKEVRYTGLAPLLLASVMVFPNKRVAKESVNSLHSFLRIGSAVVFAVACWYFGVRDPARSYNLQALAPFMLTALGGWIVTGVRGREVGMKFLVPFSIVSLAIMACGLGFVRSVVLHQFANSHGMKYSHAAEALGRCLEASNEAVDVSMQFITLCSSPRVRGIALHSQIGSKYFMLAQTYSGRTSPPKISGYELVDDQFTQAVPRFLGVKIASSPGGYNFAIYRRVDKAMSRESQKNASTHGN